MKAVMVMTLFGIAVGIMYIAQRVGFGRRLAVVLCLMAATMACSGAAKGNDGTGSPLSAGSMSAKKDPLRLGIAWSDFADVLAKIDVVTAGDFDRQVYNTLTNDLYRCAEVAKEAALSRSTAENNAVEILHNMYSSLLFDWYAMNSMITCYQPALPPTEPKKIAQQQLNRRLIEIHNQYKRDQLDRSAYESAILGIVDEQKDLLDADTREMLSALLADSVAAEQDK